MSAHAELGTLEASGLIQVATLQPELEYLFRHVLVQQAAYASLLKQDRRALHLAAAEAILALHPEREHEYAAVIGMHLEQAGDVARAARYLIVAGDHALERFANREAMGFFVRAAELAGDMNPDLRLKAAIGAARAGWTYNATGADIDRLEQALAGTAETDPLLVTEAYFWVAFLRRQRGESPQSSDELRHALERATETGKSLGDSTVAALPKALMGSFLAFMGNIREGAEDMQSALDVIEKQGDAVSIAMVSDFLAIAYARLGQFDDAERIIARAEQSAGNSDAIARVDVDISRSAVLLERGETEKARVQARECAKRAEDLGAFACVVAANTMFGAASLARQDASGAKPPLERGSELSEVTNMAAMRTLIQGLLGSTRAALGDMPGGVEEWDAALDNAQSMGDRYGEAQTRWGRGQTYVDRQEWSTALPDLDAAVGSFEDMEARPSLARALHDRAKALAGLGRKEDADRDERRSLELGHELGLKDSAFA